MKIRNGWVGNSSSSSFIIVGGSIDFEGNSLSFEEFSEQYLESCIFGNWFDYNLKESHGRRPIVSFVKDENFAQSFRNEYSIVLPLSCKDKYEQLKNKILSKRYTNKENYIEQIEEIYLIKNEIVKYCKQLIEPFFKDKEINVYTGSDHVYGGDDFEKNEESYVRDLFYEASGFYKKEFNVSEIL